MFFLQHPFLVIFTVALLESMLLAKVGSTIGWGVTILLLVASTMLGSFMVRQQGFQTFRRLQMAMARGENPGSEMLEGVFIMAGGMLLVTPGFISDAIGFLLLMPFTRKALVALIARRLSKLPMASSVAQDQWTYQYRPGSGGNIYDGEQGAAPAGPGDSPQPGVIEGEFTRKED